MKYLPIVCKVDFEDVLDVGRVDSENIVAEGGEDPEGPVLAGEVGLKICQSTEV